MPLQDPPQWTNEEPSFGPALSPTLVPAANVAVHAPGQAIPAGLLTTPPLPRTTTVNVTDLEATAGVATLSNEKMASATPAKYFVARPRPADSTLVINFQLTPLGVINVLPLASTRSTKRTAENPVWDATVWQNPSARPDAVPHVAP